MRNLKQNQTKPFGGINIVFSGDMRQLEPVGENKKPVYEQECPIFKNSINCFIELKGLHRFKQDLEWGKLLYRFRNGEVTEEDIDTINNQVVDINTNLPSNIKYATYYNRDRDAINTALFETRCIEQRKKINNTSFNDTLMIFSDNIKIRDGSKKYVPFNNKTKFWTSCSENDIKLSRGKGRLDPVLKIYIGCRVMLTINIDVKNGQANGTQAFIDHVKLKENVTLTKTYIGNNLYIPSVSSLHIDYITLIHENKKVQPNKFNIYPKEHSFECKLLLPPDMQQTGKDTELFHMKATQFQIIINNATTGHKLQGSGVENLFVHNWYYVTNWVYVILSRVKTKSGLFLRKKLDEDLSKYLVPKNLTRMLAKLRHKTPIFPTEEEDDDLFDLFGLDC